MKPSLEADMFCHPEIILSNAKLQNIYWISRRSTQPTALSVRLAVERIETP
jgi:hypothetical protein